MPKTIGEQRVRTEFNPAQSDTVSQIKQKTAKLINLCHSLNEFDFQSKKSIEQMERDVEKSRLIALAQTAYEEAAMWAVKAATA